MTATTVLHARGDMTLEPLDRHGREWYGDGPGGAAMGDLGEVVRAAGAPGLDEEWVAAVVAALEREVAIGWRRSRLLVQRAARPMYHAAPVSARASIAAHGLDWTRMADRGIAGSEQAEWPGVFLASSLEGAGFFAGMRPAGQADVWEADVTGRWVEGAPDDDGGDDWMICPEPIPPTLLRRLPG